MNKAELIESIAGQLKLGRKQVEETLDAFEAITTETLARDGEVTLTGFGSFSSRIRGARMGVNPRNPGERIQVEAVRVPKFKAGKNLKEALKRAPTGTGEHPAAQSEQHSIPTAPNPAT